ncbi:MAG: hypothetical protein CMJ64_16270 [Planctomycetaceae bacterium]|nr:hypothetical protein [Planctomycetaceae bacterium]
MRPHAATWTPLLLILLGAAVCFCPLVAVSSSTRLLREAAAELSCERYAEAERLAVRAMSDDPTSVHARGIAGEAAAKQHRDEQAIEYLRGVLDDGSVDAIHALYRLGERSMVVGHAQQAEQALRLVLNRNSTHLQANRKLAKLLQIQGRTWESMPLVETLALTGQFRKAELMVIGDLEDAVAVDYQFVETCLDCEPTDSLILLGRTRVAIRNQRDRSSEQTLRNIVALHPHIAESQVRLGQLLWERGTEQEFLDWHAELGETADGHPEMWFLRGLWAKSRLQDSAAIRCFLEATERFPNHSGAGFQLSQLMRDTDDHQVAQRLAERAKLRRQVEYVIGEPSTSPTFGGMRKVVGLLKSLGQPFEAAAWCHVALLYSDEETWARDELRELRLAASESSGVLSARNHPLQSIDKERFPLPVWPEHALTEAEVIAAQSLDGNVQFIDMASDVGIRFDYYNGTTASTGLVHILQATGGGIGVIDYDQDGWPDLYFAQSGPFPVDPTQIEYRDRLFRNLGNGRFADVTAQAGLGDGSYSQGVSAGDFNSDGYPDLYVANVYGNRLYANNGDGTFRDVTEEAGVAGDKWTTSCMIADLNGDALPDLYEVNYALMQEVIDIVCKHEGQPKSCTPTMYTAEQDRLYVNLGDGRFEDVTDASGIVASDGKGLGVVAADFDGTGRLNVFVGNDTTANFYFVNQSTSPETLSFQEQAVLMGLGFDELGLYQACMGLAVDDANGDGRLDLFVTNFYDESNTLYVQNSDRSYGDQTRDAGLREPSLKMLGFGAQFLDAELDGWPDLVLANGHVDRTFATGVPDRMTPQFFRNSGKGKFVELSAASLGMYFQEKYLGRALAVLDWNRDGREDFCVSHLDAPAALLSNQTPDAGHFLALRLRGVQSNRDAIGTVVRVKLSDRVRVRQVIGGDGYLVSNQRQLVFGLGKHQRIEQLSIEWPSGLTQTFHDVVADRETLLVEGSRNLVFLE